VACKESKYVTLAAKFTLVALTGAASITVSISNLGDFNDSSAVHENSTSPPFNSATVVFLNSPIS